MGCAPGAQGLISTKDLSSWVRARRGEAPASPVHSGQVLCRLTKGPKGGPFATALRVQPAERARNGDRSE